MIGMSEEKVLQALHPIKISKPSLNENVKINVIASHSGVLAIADGKVINFYSTKKYEETSINSDLRGDKPIDVNQFSSLQMNDTIVWMDFNCDGSILSVAMICTSDCSIAIKLFDVNKIVNNLSPLLAQYNSNIQSKLNDLKWHPNYPKMLSIIINDICSLCVVENNSLKCINSKMSSYCVSWSPKGKQLSVLMKNPSTGMYIINQFDVNMAEKRSSEIGDVRSHFNVTFNLLPTDLCWINTYNFVISFHGDTTNTDKYKVYSCSYSQKKNKLETLQDLKSSSDCINPDSKIYARLYNAHIIEWNMIVLVNNTSENLVWYDIGADDELKVASTYSLPVDGNIIGMCCDFTSDTRLPSKWIKDSHANTKQHPIVFLLCSDGTCFGIYLINYANSFSRNNSKLKINESNDFSIADVKENSVIPHLFSNNRTSLGEKTLFGELSTGQSNSKGFLGSASVFGASITNQSSSQEAIENFNVRKPFGGDNLFSNVTGATNSKIDIQGSNSLFVQNSGSISQKSDAPTNMQQHKPQNNFLGLSGASKPSIFGQNFEIKTEKSDIPSNVQQSNPQLLGLSDTSKSSSFGQTLGSGSIKYESQSGCLKQPHDSPINGFQTPTKQSDKDHKKEVTETATTNMKTTKITVNQMDAKSDKDIRGHLSLAKIADAERDILDDILAEPLQTLMHQIEKIKMDTKARIENSKAFLSSSLMREVVPAMLGHVDKTMRLMDKVLKSSEGISSEKKIISSDINLAFEFTSKCTISLAEYKKKKKNIASTPNPLLTKISRNLSDKQRKLNISLQELEDALDDIERKKNEKMITKSKASQSQDLHKIIYNNFEQIKFERSRVDLLKKQMNKKESNDSIEILPSTQTKKTNRNKEMESQLLKLLSDRVVKKYSSDVISLQKGLATPGLKQSPKKSICNKPAGNEPKVLQSTFYPFNVKIVDKIVSKSPSNVNFTTGTNAETLAAYGDQLNARSATNIRDSQFLKHPNINLSSGDTEKAEHNKNTKTVLPPAVNQHPNQSPVNKRNVSSSENKTNFDGSKPLSTATFHNIQSSFNKQSTQLNSAQSGSHMGSASHTSNIFPVQTSKQSSATSIDLPTSSIALTSSDVSSSLPKTSPKSESVLESYILSNHKNVQTLLGSLNSTMPSSTEKVESTNSPKVTAGGLFGSSNSGSTISDGLFGTSSIKTYVLQSTAFIVSSSPSSTGVFGSLNTGAMQSGSLFGSSNTIPKSTGLVVSSTTAEPHSSSQSIASATIAPESGIPTGSLKNETTVSASTGLFGTSITSQTPGIFESTKESKSQTTAIFGSESASKTQTTELFASDTVNPPQTTGVFGSDTAKTPQTTGVFGSSNTTTQSTGLIGTLNTDAPKTGGLFGSPNAGTPQTGGLFGSPNAGTPQTGGLFRSPNAGTPQTGGLFGSPNTGTSQTGGLFGSPNKGTPQTSGLFGSPNTGTPQTSGLFGSSTTSTSQTGGVFGSVNTDASKTSGLFGSTNIGASTTGGLFGSANKGVSQTGGLFGSANASTPSCGGVFGSANANTPQTTGLFGSVNTGASQTGGVFGTPNTVTPQTGGLFGSSSTETPQTSGLFGSASTGTSQTGGLFGSSSTEAPQTGGLFGSSSTGTSQTGGLFGSASTGTPQTGGLFGSANTGTSQTGGLFGSASTGNPQTGGLFGSANTGTPQTGGLFGSNNASTASPSGLFGSQGSAPGGLFNTSNQSNTSTSSLFGSAMTGLGGQGTNKTSNIFASNISQSNATDSGNLFKSNPGQSNLFNSANMQTGTSNQAPSTLFGSTPSFGIGNSATNTASSSLFSKTIFGTGATTPGVSFSDFSNNNNSPMFEGGNSTPFGNNTSPSFTQRRM